MSFVRILSSRPLLLAVGFGALALVLRIVAACSNNLYAMTDQVGYLTDGLLLLEGLPLGYKHTPNAVMNWLVFFYAGAQTAAAWLGGGWEPSVPALLRPLLALERVLFANYADLGDLRRMVVVLQVAVGTLAAAGVAWRGYTLAGTAGALLGGALAAATPIFVEFTAQTKAYSFAWSFAMLAFVAASTARRPWRAAISGGLMGVALATRVEMGLALVPLLIELMQREEDTGRRRVVLVQALSAAIVVFLLMAPWYVTSLAGNLRQIISVRLLNQATEQGATMTAVQTLVLTGVGLPILGSILALLLAPRSDRAYAIAIGLWMALLTVLALKPSTGGLRHDGALLLLASVMAPMALSQVVAGLARWRSYAPVALASLLAFHVTVVGGSSVWAYWRDSVTGDMVAWIEGNVPAGTTVYWSDGFKVPLPTTGAADALWEEVAGLEASRVKFRRAMQRMDLGVRQPHAMAEDAVQLDRAMRRGWFILGAPVDTVRPRYNVRPVGAGSPFGVSHRPGQKQVGAQPPDNGAGLDQVVDNLCAEGGAFGYYGSPWANLGKPTVFWPPASGRKMAMIIYVFPPVPPGGPKNC